MMARIASYAMVLAANLLVNKSIKSSSKSSMAQIAYRKGLRLGLSLQARLHGGTWHALLPEGHTGIAEVKWCANRLVPFLCIDPQVGIMAVQYAE